METRAPEPPPAYLSWPYRWPGKKRAAWHTSPAFRHHLACLAANRPCVLVRTHRTRCSVALDLTTIHRELVRSHASETQETDAAERVMVAALQLGAREVFAGGLSIHVYGLPIAAADEVAALLLALAADPGATRPRFTYGNRDPEHDPFDEARHECRAL